MPSKWTHALPCHAGAVPVPVPVPVMQGTYLPEKVQQLQPIWQGGVRLPYNRREGALHARLT